MRTKRTKDEDWAIGQLKSHLESRGEDWAEDPDIIDSPDLALEDNESGKRVACEITTVGLNEWHRWANDPSYQLDVDELDEIVCPREPDYWLKMVLGSKNPKIPRYLENASASEAWLLIHGDAHDFFVLDDHYDVPVMQDVASNENHHFKRIYVASPQSKSKQISQVFPSTFRLLNPPDLGISANIRWLKIRSMKLDLSKGGVVRAPIGREFMKTVLAHNSANKQICAEVCRRGSLICRIRLVPGATFPA